MPVNSVDISSLDEIVQEFKLGDEITVLILPSYINYSSSSFLNFPKDTRSVVPASNSVFSQAGLERQDVKVNDV